MSHHDTKDYVRKTKIVATMGPACQKYETIEALIKAGVNVFRLNFSFGTYDDMASFVSWIRAASSKLDVPVAILGDLQGPKFRTGEQVNETIDLAVGHKIRLAYAAKTDQSAKGTAEKIYCPHENLMQALQPSSRILIYDGAMELRVTEKHSPTEVTCEVVRGGALRAHKGLNVPSVVVPFPDLLEKDKRDALWMLGQQLDYVGQSFVQTAADVVRLREFWRANLKPGQRIPLIIAKIEKPQAVEDLDKILEAADGLMVARGDLGVELSLELVPIAQKRIIQRANAARKPVITATQMLQSMTTEQVPTRAEVSDVANAVFDGTDAVMTSQETSMSPHPVLVIETMANIVKTAEMHLHSLHANVSTHASGSEDIDDDRLRRAISASTLDAASRARARGIIVFSGSGEMAREVSKGRPQCPIVAVTQTAEVQRMLALFYAIYPIVVPLGRYTDPTVSQAEIAVLEHAVAGLKRGDRLILCSGALADLPGLAYSTKITRLGAFLEHVAGRWLPKGAKEKDGSHAHDLGSPSVPHQGLLSSTKNVH